MQLSKFKKELAKTGVSYELLKKRFSPGSGYPSYSSLEELISKSETLYDVLCSAFYWSQSPEGSDFWWIVSQGMRPITKEREVFNDYCIGVSQKQWFIGPFFFSKSDRQTIFQILADNLGYHITDAKPTYNNLRDFLHVFDDILVHTPTKGAWTVGCQKISRKQRMKMFQLLADDLGYEICD